MTARPVKPRHAASLVLTRQRDGVTQILMGRRPAKAVFPEAYVFPGGRVDPSDAAIAPSAPMSAQALAELCARGGCTPALARALATTAIRETFEETGLILAGSGDTGRRDGAWEHFASLGLAPAHDRLRFLGRAITPAAAPVRFHARFFLADGDEVSGEIKSNGELSVIDWYPLAEALNLPAIDVTKFVLGELASVEQGIAREAPFFRYRRNKPLAKSQPTKSCPSPLEGEGGSTTSECEVGETDEGAAAERGTGPSSVALPRATFSLKGRRATSK